MFDKYCSVADFLTIYIFEAHATDEWHVFQDVCFKQPTTLQARLDVAKQFIAATGATIPIVLDNMDNTAEAAFCGWPERLWVVDSGVVQYKGGLGPDDYKPAEVEAWLRKRFPDV